MSSPVQAPRGWPVVRPLPRWMRWLYGTALMFVTAALVLKLVLGFEEQVPWWRVLVIGAGLVLSGTGLVCGWWIFLRRTPSWVTGTARPAETRTRAQRRELRRTLLSGGTLADDDARWVAIQVAQMPLQRWLMALIGSVTGMNLLTVSSPESSVPSAVDVALLVLGTVPLLALGIMAGTLLWLRPVRRAAEAIGAVPVVDLSEPRATRG